MKQQFMAERAENRIEMKVTAMLVGRHDKLGSGTGHHGEMRQSPRSSCHLDERMDDRRHPSGCLASRPLHVRGPRRLL